MVLKIKPLHDNEQIDFFKSTFTLYANITNAIDIAGQIAYGLNVEQGTFERFRTLTRCVLYYSPDQPEYARFFIYIAGYDYNDMHEEFNIPVSVSHSPIGFPLHLKAEVWE